MRPPFSLCQKNIRGHTFYQQEFFNTSNLPFFSVGIWRAGSSRSQRHSEWSSSVSIQREWSTIMSGTNGNSEIDEKIVQWVGTVLIYEVSTWLIKEPEHVSTCSCCRYRLCHQSLRPHYLQNNGWFCRSVMTDLHMARSIAASANFFCTVPEKTVELLLFL
jgi:hypothetical protein